ncbi:MAG: DUF2779 domain-containing protein [Bacteroidetes bacterium]|nr:DUF2779 domain-containing protein [Bacteroidota bacterium]
MTDSRLTVKKILSGNTCRRKLWFKPRSSQPAEEPRPFWKISHQKSGIYRKARALFPGGIRQPDDWTEGAESTRTALAEKAGPVYEAVFVTETLKVRCDILVPEPEGWAVYKVKSATRIYDRYVEELAVQALAARENGVFFSRLVVLTINPLCGYGDEASLFIHHDVTRKVFARLDSLREKLDSYRAIPEAPAPPDAPRGYFCSECTYLEACWEDLPRHPFYHLPGLHQLQLELVNEQSAWDLEAVSRLGGLTPVQQEVLASALTGKPVIRREILSGWMNKLVFPVFFIDFEADCPPAPKFPGTRAFDLIPYQFSLHILQEDGRLEEKSFLHTEDSDSRPGFIQALLEWTGETGTLVVYNQLFEQKVIEDQARWFPGFADRLLALVPRLWDLHQMVSEGYYHPGFHGRTSLKQVLPVLVPDLTYSGLNVKSGLDTQLMWNSVIRMPPSEEKDRFVADLISYCRMDTLGMVRVLQTLGALINPAGSPNRFTS